MKVYVLVCNKEVDNVFECEDEANCFCNEQLKWGFDSYVLGIEVELKEKK